MICTLTARRIKPGTWDDFRAAWGYEDMPEEIRERWNPVYHVRDISDENVVISFGFFDGSVEELRELQQRAGREDHVERMTPYLEEVVLDGAYEVVEKLP